MIGQSVINVKSGATTRLSTFTAGFVLMLMIIVLGDFVVQIPMPILAGIMIVVTISTFDWKTFRYMQKAPRTDAFVMLITVAIILVTNNLAVGVVAGVFFSAIFFATKISKVKVISELTETHYVFHFEGQVFFASIDTMIEQLDFKPYDKDILLDFSKAHLWDDSAVNAIDTMVRKFEDKGNTVYVDQLNADSRKIVKELSQLNEQHLT